MLRIVDRIFGILLALASCGHAVGTMLWTQPMSGIFIWSLGSSLAGGLLAALNIVRAGRHKSLWWRHRGSAVRLSLPTGTHSFAVAVPIAR
jgi:hypothetical protein